MNYKNAFKWTSHSTFDPDDVLCKIAELAKLHYDQEGGHGWYDHIIGTAMTAQHVLNKCNPDLDPAQLAVAIMYHDAALRSHGRDDHEIWSAYIVERELKHMLDAEAVENITTAIIDHRNSKKYARTLAYGKAWRTIYSEYLAAADRGIPYMDRKIIFRRAIETMLKSTDDIKYVVTHALEHVKHKYGQHDDYLPVPYLITFQDQLKEQRELINSTSFGEIECITHEIIHDWDASKQGEMYHA